MKIKIIKAVGRYADEDSIGKIHLKGAIDATACGLAYEEYDYNKTSQTITCETCLTFLDWAKKVSNIKK